MRRLIVHLCTLCVVACASAGCADRLLLHPTVQNITPPGAKQVAIPFSSGMLQIWTKRDRPDAEFGAIVVEFFGNASRAEDGVNATARRWRAVNAEVWAVNYPGFGGSSGVARLGAIGPAALCAFDAAARAANGRPVFVVGRSIGTAAALSVAARRPVAGVTLHSPTPFGRVIMGRFGWWNLWLVASAVTAQVPGDLDSVSNARRCTAPAVFIISEQDRLVTAKAQRVVQNAYGGQRREISLAAAGHSDSPTADEEGKIDAAVDWLLSGRPAAADDRP